MKNLNGNFLLRLFLGLVFLSAGIYRIFYWSEAELEIKNLNLYFPYFISTVVVLLEIISGLFLILNIQTKKTLLSLAIFLTIALLWSLIMFWQDIILNFKVLFIFNANATDFFLHFTYLIILIYLFFDYYHNDQTCN